MNTLKCLALVPALMLIAAAGCIKRSETITIFEDGRLRLTAEIVGDPDDVYNGDAMPTAESGWQIEDRIETDSEGKKELTRTATREIAAGAAIPDSYAAPNSRLDLTALQFPTTVTIEHRDDGTYYHFRRTYQRREYSALQYWKDRIMESDEIKDITQTEPQELSDEQRARLAQALIDVEADQTAAYVEQTGLAMADAVSQEALLHARRGALKVYKAGGLLDQVVKLLGQEDDKIAQEVERIEGELHAQVRPAIASALHDANLGKPVIDQFLDRYELAREAFEITGDLSDESWFVEVTMPGRIIAHNSFGDSSQFFHDMLEPQMDENVTRHGLVESKVAVIKNGQREIVTTQHEYESRSNKVAWEFNGKALRDRDVVLMATSFVPKGTK
ncbi:MAG: hypothetical protein IH895_06380 [Planctomycetes bacterium]|nr:hypothetical protein [Planctomycetota bacterium]